MNRCRHHLFGTLMGVFLLVLLTFAGAARAATLTVTSTADSEAGTLRKAISDAVPGDTIQFALTYPAVITLASPFTIDKNLVIAGPGAANLTLNGNDAVRIFVISTGTTASFSGLSIANGRTSNGASQNYYPGGNAQHGGAIHNSGNLTLTDVVMTGNRTGDGGSANGCYNAGSGGHGGSIYSSAGSTLALSAVTISGSLSGKGGDNPVGCYASGYRAGSGGDGGAIYSAGALAINRSSITANASGAGGNSAGYNVTDSATPGGPAGRGGAIFSTGNNPVTITDTVMVENSAGNGGYGTGSSNPVGKGSGGNGGSGGGIYLDTASTVDIGGSVFLRNKAGLGGAGYQGGAGGHGGAIYNAASTMTISGALFAANRAGDATNTGGYTDLCNGGSGGSVFNKGHLSIENTTMTGGLAGNGAGILMGYGNAHWGGLGTGVGNGGNGGNLYHESGTLNVTNATIASGKAGNRGAGSWERFGQYGTGGGIYLASGTPTVVNSIVSNNTLFTGTAEDIKGVVGSASSYNLVRVDTGLTGITDGANHNRVGTVASPVEPLLDVLAENPGASGALALLLGSPAIDAGDDASCPATDQRGMTRPQGQHCDMGAYELVPLATTTVLASSVNPSSFGQSLTFTATVAVAQSDTPTGAVEFKDGAATLGSSTLSSGAATLSTSALAVGSHSITATYAASPGFEGSASSATTQVVNKAEQTITATIAAPAAAGYRTQFTVGATASSGLGVAITTSGSCSGSGTGSATIAMTSSTGTCTVRYNQAGNGNYKAAAELTASSTAKKADPTTSAATSQNPCARPAPATFTATVPIYATGTVTFSEGAETYCASVAISGGQAVCVPASLGIGPHTITARYGGDDNYNAASSTIIQTVVPETMRVTESGAASGMCESWTSACDLQYALALAPSANVEIWVRTGTYKPTAGTERGAAFRLKKRVALYGGFAGSETSRSQRDAAANLTVLSGDIGAPDHSSDNSYHVVTAVDVDHTAILDGFTVTGGYADLSPDDSGAGMYNLAGSPTVSNVSFSENAAAEGGGGMENRGSSNPVLTNVSFRGNTAGKGGGMHNDSSSPLLSGVTFSANAAEEGGGVYNYNSSPGFTNATFQGNTATYGGGMYNYGGSPQLSNLTFGANSARNSGGAVFNDASNPVTVNAIVWGNAAPEASQLRYLGAPPPVSYSIVQDGYPGTGNSSSDPLLGTLGDYGGATRTIPLLAASPAIDAGSPTSCPSTDQRGTARPKGGACDIGAYEFTPATAIALASPSAAYYGRPATFTATVTDYEAASTATGTVTFLDEGVEIGTAQLDGSARAGLTVSTLSLGSHAITAAYAGDSSFSASSSESVAQVVAESVKPGAPVIAPATAGDALAVVAFTAPADDGGEVILSYTATSSPGGFTATGSASPITVTGLGNGTAYTFTVAATNTRGTGDPSAPSSAVTPLAPRLVVASVNGGASPMAGVPFGVVVQSWDAAGNPAPVAQATQVELTLGAGTGPLGGIVTGIMAEGQSSITLGSVTYPKSESGVVLTTSAVSGDSRSAGDSAPFSVAPGAAATLTVAAPVAATAGEPFDFTVTVQDRYSNVVTGYSGALRFGSSDPDPALILPADYVFTPGDNGSKTLSAALKTGGAFTVKALSAGVVAYWPFDEGEGTSTAEVAGAGQGTLLNTAPGAWSSGAPAIRYQNIAGLNLDGGNDTINAGSEVNLANSSFSLGVWVKRGSTGSHQILASQGNPYPNAGLHVGFRSNDVFTCAFWGNDLNTLSGYADTEWHHWACTFDAGTKARRIYRDGVQVAADTASANLQSSGDFHIGSTFGYSDFFSGGLDDMFLFNRVLTAEQLALIASGERPVLVGESGGVVVNDGLPPSAAISYAPARPYKEGDSVTVTATFSEQMAASPAPRIAISGANTLAAAEMTRVSANVYTYRFTAGPGDGTASISIAQGADLTGISAQSTPVSGASFTVDNSAPEAPVIVSPAVNAPVAGSTTLSGSAEPHSTVRVYAGGALAGTGPADAAGAWSFPATFAHGATALSATATDSAGNAGPACSQIQVTVDVIAPSLTIGAPSARLAGAGPVNYTVTYTGAEVVTLSAAEVILNATGSASGTVSVTGSGANERTVTISGISGSGTLGFSIAAGTAADFVGNRALGSRATPVFLCAGAGKTVTVTDAGNDGPGTLREALAEGSPACAIDFDLPAASKIVLTSPLIIAKDVMIDGPGAANLTISGDNASRIFVVNAGRSVVISGLTVSQGATSENGGGIYNNGNLAVSDSTISGNSATGGGGGIYSTGNLAVTNATISGNSAGNGGGINNSGGNLTFTNSAMTGNSSAWVGGGIYNNATVAIANSTVSSNTAGYYAGAVYNYGTLSLTNATITGNTSRSNDIGGIVSHGGMMTIANTIIADNFPGDCVNYASIANANSLIRYGSCGSAFQGEALMDPAGLLDNGGPTKTIALLSGSPALNAGDPSFCPSTDQRGVTRTQGSACDIGAYQFTPATAIAVAAPAGPAYYGRPLTFTASVTDSEPASSPTGLITFLDSGIAIGTGSLDGSALASFTTSGLSIGSHTITASYAGDSSFSASVSGPMTQPVADSTIPSAPVIGTAAAGNAFAAVAFAPPSDDGGAAILSYQATSSPGGITATGAASPITVTGLNNGTAYTFTVTATNDRGTGAVSAASNSVTPTAPTRLVVTSVNGGSRPLAGAPFDIEVQARDDSGNARGVAAATEIALTLDAGTGMLGGSLTGTFPRYASSVTISSATYLKAEPGVVVTASAVNGDSLMAGNSAPFTVDPGAAAALVISAPATVQAGVPFALQATVKDAHDNTVTGHTGTITFRSSDPAAALPADYAFLPGDHGSNTFSPALSQAGAFAIEALDSTGAFGYWPFDEREGTATADATGAHHGTLVNTEPGIWSSGAPAIKYRNPAGLALDGSNDTINAGNGLNLSDSSFSLGVWAKRGSTGFDQYLVSQGTPGTDRALHVGFRYSNVFTCAFWGDDLNTPSTYTDTEWHHWACTFDSATRSRKIYRDGVQVAADTATGSLQSTGAFHIGSLFGYDAFFRGGLDDMFVSRRVLTAQELASIASGRPPVLMGESGAIIVDDGIDPSASISYAPARAYKDGDLVTITATFSEPMAASPAPRIAVSGANTLAAAEMTRVDATRYTYRYTAGPGNGEVRTWLSAGVDLSGSPVQPTPASGETFSVDNIPPGAPVMGAATAGNGFALVNFSAPADDGGTDILSYTVTSSPGGITAAGSASPIAVTGLTNGTAYTFTVKAINAMGYGPDSEASATAIPRAPSRLAVTSVNGDSRPLAGAPFSVVIESLDDTGNAAGVSTATEVAINLGAGTGTLGGTLTGTIAQGESRLTISSITYRKAESGVVVRASAVNGDSLTAGDSASFTVDPGTVAALTVAAPEVATAGIPLHLDVAVKDAYGNLVSDYAGRIALTSSDPTATLAREYTFIDTDNGSKTFDATLNKGGAFTFKVVETDGVIAYWPLDEGQGTATADIAGAGQGTLIDTGTETWGSGAPRPVYQNSAGLNLDGGNDTINAGSGVNLADSSFSLGVWAKRGSTGANHFIASQGYSDINHGLHVGFRDSNVFTCAFWGNDLDTPSGYADTEWHHWACTFDAGTRARKIYRDGVQVAADTATANLRSAGDFHIGSRFGNSDFFSGSLDDIFLFNRVLTAEQLALIASGERPVLLGESGAVLANDGLPPSAAISYAPARPYREGDSVTVTATFSEQMAASPAPRIAVSGANTLAAAEMTRVSANVYTYRFTAGPGDGTASISLSQGADLTGNSAQSTPVSGASFTVDNSAPEAPAIVSPAVNAVVAARTTVSGTAEPHSTVQVYADGMLAVSGPADATGAWSLELWLEDGAPVLSATATDLAGNTGPASSQLSVTVDAMGPSLTIGAPSATVAGADPINYTIAYTGAEVITLSASDVMLRATGTASGTVSVSGSGASERTVTISGISGSGSLGFSIGRRTASDPVGNPAADGFATPFFVCSGTGISVTSSADSGAGTLRQALADITPGCAIDFDLPGAAPHVITLTSGALEGTDAMINGPGADSLTISGNKASGVFTTSDTVLISGLTVSQGSAEYGAGILNAGNLIVTNSTISGNASLEYGGGIFNAGNSVTIANSTISGNTAWAGAGIMNQGRSATIVDATISDNAASIGAGIVNLGTMMVANSTVSGNPAAENCGGIYNGRTLSVINSTISGNSATIEGGGICNGGALSLGNATISGNSAAGSGGIVNRNRLSITNTAISGSGNGDCSNQGMIYPNAHNLIQDGSCQAAISGDPLLDPAGLQDNGGPTRTTALLLESPAIGAGEAAFCPGTDQRGFPRPQGSACDIGAYEFSFVTADYSAGANGSINGGNVSKFVKNGADGPEVTAAPATGYHFVNWSDGSTANPRTDSVVTGPVSVTAHFAINNYPVSFDSDGGSAVGSATANHGSTITQPAVPAKAGYIFSGWYKARALTDAWNFASDTITAGTTLYAKWIAKTVATVTLGNLNQTYDGAAKSATAATNPPGMTVILSYDGSPTAPRHAGSYPVTGTISDANYQGSASGTLTIAKANASVTLISPMSATYDGAPKGATEATTIPAGLSVVFTYDGSATAPTDAGSYAVVGTVSDLNYSGSAGSTLTIGKASQSLGFNAIPDRYYGDADFVPGATTTSYLPIGFTSDNPSVATITASGSVHIVGAGSAVISAALPGDNNFNPATAIGTLTVRKATLTVTAQDTSAVAGEVGSKTFTAAYSGFVHGESISAISGSPAFTTTATDASGIGSYSITPSLGTLSAANYAFSFAEGTLALGLAQQSISFNPIPPKTYGAAAIELASFATGGPSGNPLSFAVTSGPGALTGSLLAITGAGDIVVVATQAGNSTYASATAQQTIRVNPAVLTVTAADASRATGETNPAFSTSYSGFVYADTAQTALSGAPSLTTTAVTESFSGSYPIIPSIGTLAAANYTFSFVTGTLAVGLSSQSISFDGIAAKTYGEAAFALSATASSGRPVVLSSSNSAVATIEGEMVTIVGAGTARISATQEGDRFYAKATAERTLTVNPALLVVTADNATRTYGAADPAFTVSYSGFSNNDTAAVLLGTPGFSVGATTASPVGSYLLAVSANNLTAGANYLLKFVAGTLTVTRSAASITLGDLSHAYNGASKAATAVTNPTGLAVNLTYGGSAAPPVNIGSYAVIATIADANYQGTASGTLVIGKRQQAIVFPALPSQVIGAADIDPGANASSGLGVVYASSNSAVATIESGLIRITGPGSTTISATQGGDETYAAAPGVERTLSVGYSSAPPTLTVSTLKNGTVTTESTLNVAGSASAINGIASITVNGVQLTISAGGAFSTALSLQPGLNTISTTVTDKGGLTAQDARGITVDLSAPMITVTSPADNSASADPLAAVTGATDDPMAGVSVTLNGAPPQAALISDGSFSASVNLAAGINTIEVTATDILGNSSVTKRTVTLDNGAPSLAIVSPNADLTTSLETLAIAGRAADHQTRVTVVVSVDDQRYTPVVVNNSFLQMVTFQVEKSYAVSVTATDEAGNTTTVHRNIIYHKPASAQQLGDIDGDGDVDLADAVQVLRSTVELVPVTPEMLRSGDVAPIVNGRPAADGVIDVADAIVILKRIVGLLVF